MPTLPAMRETLRKHQNYPKTEWEPTPENFDVDEGDYDYDLNSMDIEENSAIARIDLNEVKSQELKIAAVIKSDVNVREPTKRYTFGIEHLAKLRKYVFDEDDKKDAK